MTLEGEPNYRDAAIEGVLRQGQVYRSGELSGLTDTDLRRIEALHHVLDLRTPRERQEQPDRLPPGIEVHPLPIHPRGREGRRLLLRLAMRRLDFDAFMHQHYDRTLFEHGERIRDAFRVLAEAEGPVLVHCTAGKDRTGVVIALLQKLLGATDEQVLADYLATNGRIDERARDIERRIRWMGGWPFSTAELAPLMEARASYLQTSFATLRVRFGDEAAYLRAQGVDEGLQEALRQRLRPV